MRNFSSKVSEPYRLWEVFCQESARGGDTYVSEPKGVRENLACRRKEGRSCRQKKTSGGSELSS